MWRRHGCRRKQAHGTENNLFIKGWDAGCGGKLCGRPVETEWGLLGWLPTPPTARGPRWLPTLGNMGERVRALPKSRGRSGAYFRARHVGAPLCPSSQDSTRNRFGNAV